MGWLRRLTESRDPPRFTKPESVLSQASSPTLRPERARELYETGDSRLWVRLAVNPVVPSGVVRDLYADPRLHRRLWGHPNLPLDLFLGIPVGLVRLSINGGRRLDQLLGEIDPDMVSAFSDYEGTVGELLETAKLLDTQ